MPWMDGSFTPAERFVPVAEWRLARTDERVVGPTSDVVAQACVNFAAQFPDYQTVVKHPNTPAWPRTVADIGSTITGQTGGSWRVREFLPTGDPDMLRYTTPIDDVPIGMVAVVGFRDRDADPAASAGIMEGTREVATGVAAQLIGLEHHITAHPLRRAVVLVREQAMGGRWRTPDRPPIGPLGPPPQH
jgi:hypothetical protein